LKPKQTRRSDLQCARSQVPVNRKRFPKLVAFEGGWALPGNNEQSAYCGQNVLTVLSGESRP
jgi:hypothetical protein